MLIIPKKYHNFLSSEDETEKAIMDVKTMFQANLAAGLTLLRVTAPMMVRSGIGLNDDLSGSELPVSFTVRDLGEGKAEIVHSLAKWKRCKLAEMNCVPGRGIYTDMNAIRRDEELDNIHSIYVDQWDWEKVISLEDRNMDFLKKTVRRIYEAIRVTENLIFVNFPNIEPILPENIFFISSEELLQLYPDKSPKERENLICKKYGAVFVSGIGLPLSDGHPHDKRAADYDDWTLNGDILVWNSVLESAFELSSMGIRVTAESLSKQLDAVDQSYKKELYYHKQILNGKLPYTIGGGIGQSRLCMFLLRKAHIGEIQSSLWPEKMIVECKEAGIRLL